MGSCFSFCSDNKSDQCESGTSAKVVTVKGDLVEYKVPVFVSQVLQAEAPSSFLCNSDCLLFEDYIPSLDLDDELQANQIYFVLPMFNLQYKLSASDMAALAVKASVALQNGYRRKKQARISPVPLAKTSFDHKYKRVSGAGARAAIGISRSGSVKRLQRYNSRRARLAARSFKLRLGTIYEGIVM